jgi:hypothetical protein
MLYPCHTSYLYVNPVCAACWPVLSAVNYHGVWQMAQMPHTTTIPTAWPHQIASSSMCWLGPPSGPSPRYPGGAATNQIGQRSTKVENPSYFFNPVSKYFFGTRFQSSSSYFSLCCDWWIVSLLLHLGPLPLSYQSGMGPSNTVGPSR